MRRALRSLRRVQPWPAALPSAAAATLPPGHRLVLQARWCSSQGQGQGQGSDESPATWDFIDVSEIEIVEDGHDDGGQPMADDDEDTLSMELAKEVDAFARARVTNCVRRVAQGSAVRESAEGDVVEDEAGKWHRARVILDLPEPYATRVAEGTARTQPAALGAAYMHAERVLDALGIPLFTLADRQRRHAESVLEAGRRAPMPGEAWEPGKVGMPPPVRVDPRYRPPAKQAPDERFANEPGPGGHGHGGARPAGFRRLAQKRKLRAREMREALRQRNDAMRQKAAQQRPPSPSGPQGQQHAPHGQARWPGPGQQPPGQRMPGQPHTPTPQATTPRPGAKGVPPTVKLNPAAAAAVAKAKAKLPTPPPLRRDNVAVGAGGTVEHIGGAATATTAASDEEGFRAPTMIECEGGEWMLVNTVSNREPVSPDALQLPCFIDKNAEVRATLLFKAHGLDFARCVRHDIEPYDGFPFVVASVALPPVLLQQATVPSAARVVERCPAAKGKALHAASATALCAMHLELLLDLLGVPLFPQDHARQRRHIVAAWRAGRRVGVTTVSPAPQATMDADTLRSEENVVVYPKGGQDPFDSAAPATPAPVDGARQPSADDEGWRGLQEAGQPQSGGGEAKRVWPLPLKELSAHHNDFHYHQFRLSPVTQEEHLVAAHQAGVRVVPATLEIFCMDQLLPGTPAGLTPTPIAPGFAGLAEVEWVLQRYQRAFGDRPLFPLLVNKQGQFRCCLLVATPANRPQLMGIGIADTAPKARALAVAHAAEILLRAGAPLLAASLVPDAAEGKADAPVLARLRAARDALRHTTTAVDRAVAVVPTEERLAERIARVRRPSDAYDHDASQWGDPHGPHAQANFPALQHSTRRFSFLPPSPDLAAVRGVRSCDDAFFRPFEIDVATALATTYRATLVQFWRRVGANCGLNTGVRLGPEIPTIKTPSSGPAKPVQRPLPAAPAGPAQPVARSHIPPAPGAVAQPVGRPAPPSAKLPGAPARRSLCVPYAVDPMGVLLFNCVVEDQSKGEQRATAWLDLPVAVLGEPTHKYAAMGRAMKAKDADKLAIVHAMLLLNALRITPFETEQQHAHHVHFLATHGFTLHAWAECKGAAECAWPPTDPNPPTDAQRAAVKQLMPCMECPGLVSHTLRDKLARAERIQRRPL